MYKNLITFIFGTFVCLSIAQDIHFSQYNASLLNLSPALTGFFNGAYRFNGVFKNQWQAVPVPYNTISMSAEKTAKLFKSNKNVAFGILFNNDRAGDAVYTINQFYLSTAYLHKLKKDSSLLMNIGVSLGYTSNAFNYHRMTFNSQFDGLQFNSSLPTNENFYRTSLHYWDVNIGTALKYFFNQKFYFIYAFTWMHINNPVVTYYANVSSKIDKKVSNYFMLQYPLTQKLYLLPEVLLSFQGKYKEIVPGVQLSYLLDNLDDIYGRVGLYFRTRDALICRMGMDYQNTSFGMSYDINTSKFVAATNSRGGFELYIIHILKTRKQYLIKRKTCPVFL